MPRVATGVRMVMASSPVLAMSPLTKAKTPWTIETLSEPPLPSNTNSSSTMRPFSSRANSLLSARMIWTRPSPPVSNTSPWYTWSPSPRATREPSARTATTSPVMSSTVPMASPGAAAPAWAYWPGASGPARRVARSPGTTEPPSVKRLGGVSVAKKSRTTTPGESGPVSTRSGPLRA